MDVFHAGSIRGWGGASQAAMQPQCAVRAARQRRFRACRQPSAQKTGSVGKPVSRRPAAAAQTGAVPAAIAGILDLPSSEQAPAAWITWATRTSVNS
jgi:hypothetical protein